jgi:hypothetical protein
MQKKPSKFLSEAKVCVSVDIDQAKPHLQELRDTALSVNAASDKLTAATVAFKEVFLGDVNTELRCFKVKIHVPETQEPTSLLVIARTVSYAITLGVGAYNNRIEKERTAAAASRDLSLNDLDLVLEGLPFATHEHVRSSVDMGFVVTRKSTE